MDLFVIKKSTYLKAMKIGFEILLGNHLVDEDIFYKQVSKLKVTADNDLDIDIDGEFGGSLPMDFEVVANAVEILVPSETYDAY